MTSNFNLDQVLNSFTSPGQSLPESDLPDVKPRAPELPTEQAASVNKMSKQTGLPRSAVQESPEEVEDRIRREGIDNILANSPRISAYIQANDKALSNQKEEWEKLGEIEQLWTGVSKGYYGSVAGSNAKTASITYQDMRKLESQIAGLNEFKATGKISPENQEALKQFNVFSKKAQVDDLIRMNTLNLNTLKKRYATSVDKSISQITKYKALPTSGVLSDIGRADTFSEAAKLFFTNPFEATIDALASSAFPMAETIGTGIAGGVTFGPPGFVAGTFGGSYSSNYNSKILEGILSGNINVKSKEDLESIIKDAKFMAKISDAANRYSTGVAAFDALGGFIATKSLSPSRFKNAAAQTGVQTATGSGGEAVGQIAETGKITSKGEIFLEGIIEGATGSIDIALGQTFAKVKQGREKIRQAVDASIKGQQLDKMVKVATALESRKADPETINGVFKAITGDDKDADSASVSVASDDLNTFFQENPEAEESLKTNAPDMYSRYKNAFETKSDVTINVSDYLTYLADYHDVLRNIGKVGDSSQTMAEADKVIEDFDKEFQNTLNDVQSDIAASKDQAEGVSRVNADILRQLRLVGFSKDEAQANSELISQVFNNLAERSGRQVSELYNEVGLQIVNQIAGINQTDQATGVLDSLRRFIPSPERLKTGATLGQTLQESGVFTEEEFNELLSPDASTTEAQRARVAKGKTKPKERSKQLLKKAAKLASGAGFIDNVESLKALNTLLDSEEKASPVRQAKERDEVSETRDAAFNALLNVFTEQGVDISDTDSALALIEKVLAGETVQQPTAAGVSFDQKKKGVKRGQITFPSTGLGTAPTLISLTENRNLSTLLHESGHLYLELLTNLANNANADSDLVKDLTAVKQWWIDNIEDTVNANGKVVTPGILTQLRERNPDKATGITADDVNRFITKFGNFEVNDNDRVILTELHEYFARGYEAYIYEGRPPSVEMKGVFYRFSQWLKQVYKSFLQFQVNLDDNIRDVFNRLVASDEAIEQVKTETEFDSAFADDGVIEPAELQEIRKAQAEVTQDAKNALEQKVLNAKTRQATKEFKAAKNRIKLEVEQEADQSPTYQATHFLLNGEFLTEGFAPDLPAMKFDRKILSDRYGREILNGLPESGGRKTHGLKREGNVTTAVDPNVIADLFGFTSGDELIKALLNNQPRKDFIEEESQRRAEIELKDPMVDGSLAQEADIAFNKSKEAFIKLELKALNKKAGLDETPTQIAKRVAKAAVDKLRTFEVQRLPTFRNAEIRAARRAKEAVLAEDYAEAARQERIRLVQHYMYTEALKQSKAVEKGLKYLKKFSKTSVRKGMTPEAVEQIDTLLARFDLSNTSLKDIKLRNELGDALTSLRSFLDNSDAIPDDMEFNDRIVSAADFTSWKELTVQQFLDMRDTVKVIAAIGRNSKKLVAQAKQILFEQARDDMLQSLDDNLTPRGKDPRDEKLKTNFQRLKAVGRWTDARLLGIEAIIEWLDGGRVDGPWRQYLWKPIADAEHNRNDLDHLHTVEIIKILEGFSGIKSNKESVFLPELNESLSREGVIAAALNTGNEGNLQRLASTYNVSEDVVFQALDNVMSKEDWDLVQSLWDRINGLWPQIVKTEEQTTGLTPKSIPPRKVITRHGEYAGGYYPIAYDRTRSVEGRIQTDVDRQFKGGYGRSSVAGGFTKERQDKIDSPLDLSLAVLPRHLSKVSHLISHKSAIMDANKILGDRQLHAALSEKLGPEYFDMFVEWVDAVAKDGFINDNAANFFSKLRSNVAISIMGFSSTTFIAQFFGLFSSAEIFAKRDADGIRMGNSYLASGISSFSRAPLETADLVRSLSGEMRHRANSIDRDMKEDYRRIAGKSGAVNATKAMGMQGIAIADMAVSVPTWLGAYHWAIDQKFTQDQAIEWADSRVRLTQGTGSVKDLSAVQRSALLKAFTMFYSYFKAMWGRQRDIGRDLKNGTSFAEIAWRSVLLIVIPATLSEVVLGRGPDCEDEGLDCILRWTALKVGSYSLAGLPVVRDAARSVDSGFGFNPTPVFEGFKFASQAALSLGKEDEAMSSFMINAVKAGAYFKGLPVTQPNRTIKHIWNYVEGETDDLITKELLFGPNR